MQKKNNLDSNQHLVSIRTKVGTFCQVNLAKSSFTQFPLQNNVFSFNVLDTCKIQRNNQFNLTQIESACWKLVCCYGFVRHSHMSFSLMMPQKYCGFSTKLDRPESSVPSSEDRGLAPKFMKRRDTARSSSVPRTEEPVDMQTGRASQAALVWHICFPFFTSITWALIRQSTYWLYRVNIWRALHNFLCSWTTSLLIFFVCSYPVTFQIYWLFADEQLSLSFTGLDINTRQPAKCGLSLRFGGFNFLIYNFFRIFLASEIINSAM